MTEQQLLSALDDDARAVQFSDVLAVIDAHWRFTPTAFSNGPVRNAAGENNGSCKVFAFASRLNLPAWQTLLLFAEHYQAVLADPQGTDHANIRAFMAHGWDGIQFSGDALSADR